MSLGIWDAALIAAKTITYAATLGAAGAVFFLKICGATIAAADIRAIRRMVPALAALAVLGGAMQILVTAGSMSGGAAGMLDGPLLRMVWQTGAGRANAIRAAGLLLATLGMLYRLSWPALLGAAVAATSFAWTGHARSLNPDAIPVWLFAIHLLGVAFWFGALAPLRVVARHADVSTVAAAAARFGRAALFVVAGLMAAGLSLLWLLLGGFRELWSSTYGRYAMFKLAFVGCLLCVAAFNKLWLTPRLLDGDPRASRILRRSIRLELLLGLSILAATATLTTVAGPPSLG
ncbi:MAG TPA: CopD family protein [Steroidobacteraceae bacterium]|nr:CopD family protein [Steroidobacteraceae bacterium]